MCGIAGIIAERIDDETISRVRRMGELIRHRGPDDEGFYSDDHIAMIHKRLSIIDLKTGHQPISNERDNLVIFYNGEIYNYRELTAQLIERGHQFKTKTDTEVIIHAYEEYGPDCVKLFNGMFAFALWDRTKKELFFARDRVGIKPFYYSQTERGFVFASEMKAIVGAGFVTAALNEETLMDFLTFQNILDEKTFFKGITKLPAGHYGLIKDGRLSITEYWDLDFTRGNFTVEDARARYAEIMDAAVKRHMIADVPVGSYLSGGFDSSSVAYFATHHTDHTLTTFTGAFNEGLPYDERQYSRLVAEKIGAKMHEVEITPEDFESLLETVVYHLDEPSIGSGALPQYVVSRLVGKHVKVVLTGHGGDEIFSGYQVFKAQAMRRRIKENPVSAFSMLPRIRPSEIFHLMYFTLFPLLVDRKVDYGLFVMFGEKERGKLIRRNYDPFDVLRKRLKDRTFLEEDRLMYLYVKTYLPTLLLQEDKVGMAHSIEARIPYCDNEVIAFASSLGSDVKLHGMELKHIVKAGMRGRLPDELYAATKKGFPTPIAKWFRGPLRPWVEKTLLSKTSRIAEHLDREAVSSLVNRFMTTRTVSLYDYAAANRIYSLITIELWLRKFVS